MMEDNRNIDKLLNTIGKNTGKSKDLDKKALDALGQLAKVTVDNNKATSQTNKNLPKELSKAMGSLLGSLQQKTDKLNQKHFTDLIKSNKALTSGTNKQLELFTKQLLKKQDSKSSAKSGEALEEQGRLEGKRFNIKKKADERTNELLEDLLGFWKKKDKKKKDGGGFGDIISDFLQESMGEIFGSMLADYLMRRGGGKKTRGRRSRFRKGKPGARSRLARMKKAGGRLGGASKLAPKGGGMLSKVGSGLSKMPKGLKVAGALGAIATLAPSLAKIAGDAKDKEKTVKAKDIGKAIGAAGGIMAGMKAGAAIGAAGGPIGMVAGVIIGAAAPLAGEMVGSYVGQNIAPDAREAAKEAEEELQEVLAEEKEKYDKEKDASQKKIDKSNKKLEELKARRKILEGMAEGAEKEQAMKDINMLIDAENKQVKEAQKKAADAKAKYLAEKKKQEAHNKKIQAEFAAIAVKDDLINKKEEEEIEMRDKYRSDMIKLNVLKRKRTKNMSEEELKLHRAEIATLEASTGKQKTALEGKRAEIEKLGNERADLIKNSSEEVKSAMTSWGESISGWFKGIWNKLTGDDPAPEDPIDYQKKYDEAKTKKEKAAIKASAEKAGVEIKTTKSFSGRNRLDSSKINTINEKGSYGELIEPNGKVWTNAASEQMSSKISAATERVAMLEKTTNGATMQTQAPPSSNLTTFNSGGNTTTNSTTNNINTFGTQAAKEYSIAMV